MVRRSRSCQLIRSWCFIAIEHQPQNICLGLKDASAVAQLGGNFTAIYSAHSPNTARWPGVIAGAETKPFHTFSLNSTDTSGGRINPRYIRSMGPGCCSPHFVWREEIESSKTLTCSFVSFKPLSATPGQWVQVVLPTDGDSKKARVSWRAPTHTGGLAGKLSSLGQNLRLPEPLKKSH